MKIFLSKILWYKNCLVNKINQQQGKTMKNSMLFITLLSTSILMGMESTTATANTTNTTKSCQQNDTCQDTLKKNQKIRLSVSGQGVAPMNTTSPAQAYALAKRAATADAYRLIAEKIKGVYVEGNDLIKNMMVKRSSIRTSVSAMVRNANVVETTFKEGLCEVEMEIVVSHNDFRE